MAAFNLPPGVSLNDEHINPSEDTWEQLFERISQDCESASMTDMDCFVAWRLGLEAFKAAHKIGGVFPSDDTCIVCHRDTRSCDCDTRESNGIPPFNKC